MATIRSGTRGALLVVDMQVGVLREAWNAARVIANTARLVERARAARVLILWVQHTGEDLPRGSIDWQWVPELCPREGEALIHKEYNSAFEETELEARLRELGVSHLVLAGASTNFCIRATAYGALERGYGLTLVRDAHTTDTLELRDGTHIDAETVIRDLNAAMAWLRYPGRANRVTDAAALDLRALRGP